MTGGGVVKLADFGMATTFGSPTRNLSAQVVTIFYRAPELLFGARAYGPAVDVWAMGCVLAELELRVPLLPGTSELDQLDRTFRLCGTPTEADWPGMVQLPNYLALEQYQRVNFRTVLPGSSLAAVELLQELLHLDPRRRPSCTKALQHAYFSSAPGPTPPAQLPLPRAAVASAASMVAAAKAAAPPQPGQAVSRRKRAEAAAASAADEEGALPTKKALLFDD